MFGNGLLSIVPQFSCFWEAPGFPLGKINLWKESRKVTEIIGQRNGEGRLAFAMTFPTSHLCLKEIETQVICTLAPFPELSVVP
jgi:hypothetical protein